MPTLMNSLHPPPRPDPHRNPSLQPRRGPPRRQRPPPRPDRSPGPPPALQRTPLPLRRPSRRPAASRSSCSRFVPRLPTPRSSGTSCCVGTRTCSVPSRPPSSGPTWAPEASTSACGPVHWPAAPKPRRSVPPSRLASRAASSSPSDAEASRRPRGRRPRQRTGSPRLGRETASERRRHPGERHPPCHLFRNGPGLRRRRVLRSRALDRPRTAGCARRRALRLRPGLC